MTDPSSPDRPPRQPRRRRLWAALVVSFVVSVLVSAVIEELHWWHWLQTPIRLIPLVFIFKLMEPYNQRQAQARQAKRERKRREASEKVDATRDGQQSRLR